MSDLSQRLQDLMTEARLPESFLEVVQRYYVSIAQRIADWRKVAPQPLLIGINGGQGTGKSTMAQFVSTLLEHQHKLSTAVLSIDDIYLTRTERQTLAVQKHPLLATRGVPGTHDPVLGQQVIESLMMAKEDEQTALPRFAKEHDDRMAEVDWPQFTGRAEVVILEGWCVGARPQSLGELVEPINDLERNEDPNGRWRRYVNDQLQGSYRPLFGRIDHLILLQAPSMACIREWRGKQEDKLRQAVAESGADADQIMSDRELDRFIAHYQRLTEHQWRDMPSWADIVLKIDESHCITSYQERT